MASKICNRCRRPHQNKGSYCDECMPVATSQKPKEAKERKAIYGTARWKRIAIARKRLEPLCRACKELGIVTPAQVADHIIEIEDGGAPYDINNTQSLCIRCNTKKGAAAKRVREREMAVNGRVLDRELRKYKVRI